MKKISFRAAVILFIISITILAIQILVTKDFDTSIFLSVMSAFLIFLALLIFLNESSVLYHTQLLKDVIEIRNSEIRDIIHENINILKINIEESKHNKISITSPNRAKSIAFSFFERGNKNTKIYATMNYVKRRELLKAANVDAFISSNEGARENGVDIHRVFIIDTDIASNDLFVKMYEKLEDMGCTLYKVTGNVSPITTRDFIISIDNSIFSKQKVFIGGFDEPTDQYEAILSFDQNDITDHVNKFTMLTKLAESS